MATQIMNVSHCRVSCFLHYLAISALVPAAPVVVHAEPEHAGEASFVTLDRVDGRSRGRVALALGRATEYGDAEDSVYDLTTMRLEAHGQWVGKHGVGGFATAGVVKVIYEGDVEPVSFPAVELGGLYAGRLHESFDIIVHAGMAFSLRNSFDDRIGSFYSGFGRITDLARNLPETTWLRLSSSPVMRLGPVVVRADLGFDVPLATEPSAGEEETLIRLGAGAAIDRGIHRAGLEYLMVMNTEARFLDTRFRSAAATYRLRLERIELYAAVVVPVAVDLYMADAGPSLLMGIDALLP